MKFKVNENGMVAGVSHPIALLIIFAALMVITLYWFAVSDSQFILCLSLIFSAIALALTFFHLRGKFESAFRIKRLFIAALFFSGLVFVFAFPPFSVPDEYHHFCSSYWISGFFTGDSSVADSAEFKMREVDYEVYERFSQASGDMSKIGASDYGRIAETFELFNDQGDKKQLVEGYTFSIGSENVIAKTGSVAGILIARALGLGGIPLFYLGRIASLALFCLLAFASYSIMPYRYGKYAIAAVSLLPMTLHLAASYSYDSGIVGLAMLFVSVLIRSISKNSLISYAEAAQILVLSSLIAPLKVVYVPLLLLVFFIPVERFGGKKKAWLFRGCALAVAAAVLIVIRMSTVEAIVGASGGLDYRGEQSGHFYDLSYLLAHPLHFFKLLFSTIDYFGDYYLFTLLGGSLGWLQEDLEFPAYLLAVYPVVSMLVIASDDAGEPYMETRMRVAFLLIACATFFCVLISMCLGWTFDSEFTIMGVQGRYFLPVLPLVFMACRGPMVRSSIKNPASMLIVTFVTMNVVYLIRTLSIAVTLA